MSDGVPVVTEIQEARRRFLELVADIRPDLHRYCARMTGSASDGEDVVQETLARAYYLLPEQDPIPPLRPWLFRIAHTRAIDYLRRYERRMSDPIDAFADTIPDEKPDPADAIARDEATRAAITRFMSLVPLQRSCVVLKDVLDYSLDEIAALLEISIPAVKAALHRGRTRLHELLTADEQFSAARGRAIAGHKPARADATLNAAPSTTASAIARFAALFNARDWDGVRSMLAEDVKLDIVSRVQLQGRGAHRYMTNYDKYLDWRFVPAWMEGQEVVAVFRPASAPKPAYYIELTIDDNSHISSIRDYVYVPYIAQDVHFKLENPSS